MCKINFSQRSSSLYDRIIQDYYVYPLVFILIGEIFALSTNTTDNPYIISCMVMLIILSLLSVITLFWRRYINYVIASRERANLNQNQNPVIICGINYYVLGDTYLVIHVIFYLIIAGLYARYNTESYLTIIVFGELIYTSLVWTTLIVCYVLVLIFKDDDQIDMSNSQINIHIDHIEDNQNQEHGINIDIINDNPNPSTNINITTLMTRINKAIFNDSLVLKFTPLSCSICMIDYVVDDLLHIYPCDHHFHEVCSVEWIEKNPSCPTCRQKILDTTQ